MVCNHRISKKVKILCMDDGMDVLNGYQALLASTENTIQCVRERDCAWETIQAAAPDLVFCKADFLIPQIPIWKDAIQTAMESSSLSIVLVYSAKQALSKSIQAMDFVQQLDYLVKPFSKQALLVKVASAVRKKNLWIRFSDARQKLARSMGHVRKVQSDLRKIQDEQRNEKAMLENSLRQIALMVDEREKIYRELAERDSVLEQNFNSLVEILSFAIESKSRFHRGHSRKVADISAYIAQKMGLPEAAVKEIQVAARLHELERLGLADPVHPETDAAEKMVLLRNQPVEIAGLLRNFSGFEQIATILKHFHENYNGTGIPERLKKDAIPIGSRILAAADLFDSLVYRKKGGSPAVALRQIEQTAGSQLDAGVIYHLHGYLHDHPITEIEKARQVKLFDLEPGMELAAGIYSQSGAKLLPMDTVLGKDTIAQLAQYAKSEAIKDIVFVK